MIQVRGDSFAPGSSHFFDGGVRPSVTGCGREHRLYGATVIADSA
jgi:hypothetical protein